ncbi:MAG: amylo-alpha-1,6-glucosidase [Phycisphaerae bacterium]
MSGSELLSIWGGGQLMAFSGIDGPTDFDYGLVARTAASGTGIEIVHPGRCLVHIDDAPPRLAIVSSDYFNVQTAAGRTRGVMLDAHHLLIEGPCLIRNCSDAIDHVHQGSRTLIRPAAFGGEGATPVAKLPVDLAAADIDGAIFRRKRWLGSLNIPDRLPPATRKTLAKALSVMKGQVCRPQGVIRHRWTTPDRWPHRGMWLWDSAFHAIGWRHLNADLAKEMIDAVFDGQQPGGMVPIRTDPAGPTSTTMTQPPVLALAASLVDKSSADPAWISVLYPRLCRCVEWDLANRDSDGAGLLEWKIEGDPHCRSGESGMDNSPRFDCGQALDAADFNSYVALECETLGKLALSMGRTNEARRWNARHARLCGLINKRLWSENLGIYVDCLAATGVQSDVMAATGFLPLICGAADEQQALRLERHLRSPHTFGTPLPVPTIAASQGQYYSKDMWRGPVWVNINWLVAYGLDRYGMHDLAGEIRRRTMAEIEHWYLQLGSIFEFFDDRRVTPPPQLLRKGRNAPEEGWLHQVIHDFGWSASLYVDMVFQTAGR